MVTSNNDIKNKLVGNLRHLPHLISLYSPASWMLSKNKLLSGSISSLRTIHGTGENQALPLTILKRFLAHVGEDCPVGVLYNLGCCLDKYIDLRKIRPESLLEFSSEPWTSTPMSTNGHARSNITHNINKDAACPTESCQSDFGLCYCH
ncbi:hypothetical protein PSTG_17280 [Puccinia striiformis f. sp. tritici PST-78]|uniref:Uncharacterized protein n=1 Tax=Puccinia striiformis f. sp. tritici PST-78 TaxID=1165861 RepID=A0A0L0UR66_9BASI|nr:hypothetical protein PSTG_17280 [Puccinia striiformis f. sp. tritici PST-78]